MIYSPENPENDNYILINYCKNDHCSEPTQNPHFCSVECWKNHLYNLTTENEIISCKYCSYDIIDDDGNIMEHYCIDNELR